MKKYLLLATVAGCVLANNAMATVEIDVSATIQYPEIQATKSNDIAFGTLIVDPSFQFPGGPVWIAEMTLDDSNNTVVTPKSEYVLSAGGSPNAGRFSVTSGFERWYAMGGNYDILCSNGDEVGSGCSLTTETGDDELLASYFDMDCESSDSGTCLLVASLYAAAQVAEGEYSGTVTVNLHY